MNEQNLEGLTPVKWTSAIWYKYRRGLTLLGHDFAVAYSMDCHPEWRSIWDTLEEIEDEDIARAVLHVHHDAWQNPNRHEFAGQPR